jgi:hypothetical protein
LLGHADRLHVDKAVGANCLPAPSRPRSRCRRSRRHGRRAAFQIALGSLGLARKAGAVALGAAKVEAAVPLGQALFGAPRGRSVRRRRRKISQARCATAHLGGPKSLPTNFFRRPNWVWHWGVNVIHAAVLAGDAGRAALKRMVALDRYRGGTPDDQAMLAAVADEDDAAEDTE